MFCRNPMELILKPTLPLLFSKLNEMILPIIIIIMDGGILEVAGVIIITTITIINHNGIANASNTITFHQRHHRQLLVIHLVIPVLLKWHSHIKSRERDTQPDTAIPGDDGLSTNTFNATLRLSSRCCSCNYLLQSYCHYNFANIVHRTKI